MNTIRETLPKSAKDFFYRLSDYLDTDLYFYGSINRADYIHGKSDIDLAVFTDNEESMISRLQHFLHADRREFSKVVWKLNGHMIYGYKIKYDKNNLNCEISVYNTEYKPYLLEDWQKVVILPLYIKVLLFILKTFHYTIPVIPNKPYANFKRFIFDKMLYEKHSVFFVLSKEDTNK